MANEKISGMATAASLIGSELVEVVQGGDNKKTTTQDIANLAVGSISGSGVTNEIAYWTSASALGSLATATYPSLTELSYVKGVTSAIQTQLGSKQATGNYITALTGDGTASGPGSVNLTVTKINGTSLAGLVTGILKNTTGTGVPSIATGADLPVMTATVGGAVPTPPNNTTTFLRGDGTFAAPAGGGDFVGPASSVLNNILTFADTTGKLGKDSGARLILNGTNGAKGHYLGYGAGNTTTMTVSDGFNTGTGFESLMSLIDGASASQSSYNTAYGYQAGRLITTGGSNNLFGRRAGSALTTGSQNTLIGNFSGFTLTTQSDNTFVGHNTGSNAANTGNFNTYIGSIAGLSNTSGSYNTGVGLYALFTTSTGNYNTGMGAEVFETNTTGSYNAGFGHWAGLYVRGDRNSFFGSDSWAQVAVNPSSGSDNVGVGFRSGITETAANATSSGNGNTFIGTETGQGSTTQINYAGAFGFRAHPSADYEFAMGSYGSTYKPNWGLGMGDFGGGRGVLSMKDADTNPTGNPTAGFRLYSASGAATIVNSSGTAFAIPRGSDYYALASGGAMTSDNTLSGNFKFITTGTVTGASDATPVYAFNINRSVTHTGSATNKVAAILNIEGTVTGSGGGATQELAALRIAPTFNTSAGSRNFYIEAISSTGGHAFEVREESEDSRNTLMKVLGGTSSATEMWMQVQTNSTSLNSTGPTQNYSNTSSSTAAVHNFNINNTLIGGFTNFATNVAGRGLQMGKLGATATGTASQIGSNAVQWWGSFWTGASLDAGFYAHLIASTVTDRLGYLRFRESISAVDPGDILSIKGGANFGLGIGVSDPTARLHLVAGTATANQGPLKFTSGTNLTTAENGTMEYNGTNLFFTRAGAVRENIICESSVNNVTPTLQNRTITVNIDGTTLYITAKTTND
jgi:hypothetical protein